MSSRRFGGTLDPRFNPFEDDYLADILKATAVAWARMNPPKRSEIEDRITFRLAGRLANDPRFSDIPYDVVPQYWLLGLDGQRLGRLDLRFKHRHSKNDYFAFESKRLHVTYPKKKLSREYPSYAGDGGMMAFVKEYYCKGFPAAGMLGYVMDGRSDIAWTGLQIRVESRRRPLKLTAGSGLATSTLERAVTTGIRGIYLGETEHKLKTRGLRLFHLLLPVRKKNSLLAAKR